MKKLCTPSLVLFGMVAACAQVGIGTPLPHGSAQLDVEAMDKGALLPRVALTGINDDTTMSNGNVEGLIVYNTTKGADIMPGYYYWSGSLWRRMGSGTAEVEAANGLYFDPDTRTIRLGGMLEGTTNIGTGPMNTLAITGLEEGNLAGSDLVLVDKQTGVLRKGAVSSLFREEVALYVAEEDQTQFNTPQPITDANKVNVYRNGVKIGHVPVNANTIALEPGVICYQGDEIRIVQFN